MVDLIQNRESGKSVRDKINALLSKTPALATRADLLAQQAAFAVGAVVSAGGVSYRYDGVSNSIADLPGWVPAGEPTPKHFGATGGGADDSAAIQALFNLGGRVSLDAMYTAKALTAASALEIVATQGGGITRAASAAVGALITATAPLIVRGGTYDGNKASQTNGGSVIRLSAGCTASEIIGATVKGAKKASGYGEGIVYNTAIAVGEAHRVADCVITGNDAAGISVVDLAGFTISGNLIHDNGGAGIDCNTYDLTLAEKISRSTVTGNVCARNQHGIAFGNFIQDNDTAAPVDLGTANPDSQYHSITGNTCTDNTHYGITAQGAFITVSGNTLHSNGAGATGAGGILANASYATIIGNTIVASTGYGIDAGGANNVLISGNNIHGATTTGISVESCTSVDVFGNRVVDSPSTGFQVRTWTFGSNGNGSWFPTGTQQVRIIGNTFSAPSGYGVDVDFGAQDVVIVGNFFRMDTTNRCISDKGIRTQIRENRLHGPMLDTVTVTGGVLAFPDVLDHVFYNAAAATTITRVAPYTYDQHRDKLGRITLTAGGSGYTTAPTVSVTGGTGTGIAVDAAINASGNVIGFRVTNAGSGYTSGDALTVSFSGGGGTGATATASIGLPLADGREISLHSNASSTIQRAGTGPTVESPSGADISVPAHGFVHLRSRFSRWQLQGKNF